MFRTLILTSVASAALMAPALAANAQETTEEVTITKRETSIKVFGR